MALIIIDAPSFDELTGTPSDSSLPTTTDMLLVRASRSEDKEVVIEGYANLKTLRIMSGSYQEAAVFKVIDCPEIRSIYIDDDCFLGDSGSITLANCPCLQELCIGKSFVQFQSVHLESKAFIAFVSVDLPSLSSISFGCWSLGNEFPQSSHSECLSELLWVFCASTISIGTGMSCY